MIRRPSLFGRRGLPAGVAPLTLVLTLAYLTGSGAFAASLLGPAPIAQISLPLSGRVVSGSSSAPAKPPVTLTPADEENLQQLSTLLIAAKQKLWLAQMKKKADDIARLTNLDEAARAGLDEPATAAVQASGEAWTPKVLEALRKLLLVRARTTEQLQVMFAQRDELAETMARQDGLVRDYVRPSEQPVWREGVRKRLTPDQLAIWTKAEDERQKTLDKLFEDSVKPQLEQVEQTVATLLLKSAEVKRGLKLPADRGDKLDALAKSATDQMVREWMKSARQGFMNLDDEQRKTMQRNNGRVQFAVDRDGVPSAETIFKEGLAKLLSDEERAKWEKIQTDQGSRVPGSWGASWCRFSMSNSPSPASSGRSCSRWLKSSCSSSPSSSRK